MTTSVPSPATRRPPLPLIFSVTATGIMVNTLVAPALPDILDGLAAPRHLSGLVIAAATLPGILIAPLVGLLADRYGRREVLVPCLVTFGVAGGLAGLAPSLPVFVGLRLLQGVGSAGLINLVIVLIGDHWEGTARARAIGHNSAVLTAGLALFPLLGGLITDVVGWRALFMLYPLALVTAAVLYRRLPRAAVRGPGLRAQIGAVAPLLRTGPVLGLLALGALAFALIFGLLLTVVPVYAETRFGIGASARGLLLGAPALANTAVALSLGRLRARFARRALAAVGAGLFAVGLAVIAGVPAVWALVTGLVVFGAGEGLLMPNLQDAATDVAPAESRGTIVALVVGAARVGQTAGPVIAGAAFAAAGAGPTFAAGAGLAAVTALLVAGGAGRRRQQL